VLRNLRKLAFGLIAGAALLICAASVTHAAPDAPTGSLLFYNLYTSNVADLTRQNTRINLTNTQPYPYGWWSPAGSGPGVLTVTSRGGLYPAGSQAPVTQTGFWPGGNVVRGAMREPTGGLVADLFGGLHPFGGAPAPSGGPYWPGQDIVRGMARGTTGTNGYVLDDWGGLHPFGGAPAVQTTGYFPGRDFVRGLALNPSGPGGWVVDADGGVWSFGGAPFVPASLTWTGLLLSKAIL